MHIDLFCILNPLLLGILFVRSGAGIVADSVPETEYQECINKAKAVVSALTLAQEEDL